MSGVRSLALRPGAAGSLQPLRGLSSCKVSTLPSDPMKYLSELCEVALGQRESTPQPLLSGLWDKTGRKLIQFESCKERLGSGKETRPHGRVQRSSHLCTISLPSTLGIRSPAEPALLPGGWAGSCQHHCRLYLDTVLPEATEQGWWRGGRGEPPPLSTHCAALHRRPMQSSYCCIGQAYVIPLHKGQAEAQRGNLSA